MLCMLGVTSGGTKNYVLVSFWAYDIILTPTPQVTLILYTVCAHCN